MRRHSNCWVSLFGHKGTLAVLFKCRASWVMVVYAYVVELQGILRALGRVVGTLLEWGIEVPDVSSPMPFSRAHDIMIQVVEDVEEVKAQTQSTAKLGWAKCARAALYIGC